MGLSFFLSFTFLVGKRGREGEDKQIAYFSPWVSPNLLEGRLAVVCMAVFFFETITHL